ncbi:MAG: LysE family translocator, partial [Pseudomonadota bacterium]|nr:LysE family translocator [Pseudomonadota bacterium]
VLKVAGALYLLWLAWGAVRHGSSLTLAREATAPQPLKEVFLTGLGINLLNPKIVLFFVTFLPQFVSPTDPHAAGKLLFLGATFILLAMPICGALILAADQVAARLRGSRRVTRVMDWLFAGLMSGFAAKLLLARAS